MLSCVSSEAIVLDWDKPVRVVDSEERAAYGDASIPVDERDCVPRWAEALWVSTTGRDEHVVLTRATVDLEFRSACLALLCFFGIGTCDAEQAISKLVKELGV